MIYLDNAATTPMDAEVVAEMMPYMEDEFANASSVYSLAREEQDAVMLARDRVAALLNCMPCEVFFTSGGTESNNWALKGTLMSSLALRPQITDGSPHIITTAIEHPSVLETCRFLERMGCRVSYLPVDSEGRVDMNNLAATLEAVPTAIVSIMYGNNEIGTVQDIARASELAHQHGALMHTDAVQAVGKVPIDVQALGVDMLSLSAHKLHGPKGVGALFVRESCYLESLMHGGDQESQRRAGTTNVAGVVGLGKAAEVAGEWLKTSEASVEFPKMPDVLWGAMSAVMADMIQRNGHPRRRLPHILNVTFQNVECNSLVLALDEQFNIFASCGSACHAKRIEPSYVLLAIGRTSHEAKCSVRFSMSRETNVKDLGRAADMVSSIAWRLRDESKSWAI